MNADVEEYYAANKYYLSRIGVWPYQQKVSKILLPCFLTAMQSSIIVTQILLLYDKWGDVDLVIESIISIVMVLASIGKLVNFVVNNDKFRRLLQFMNDQWVLFNNESERYILKYYAEISRRLTKYYATYCYGIFVLYVLVPLIPRFLDIVKPLNESRPLKFIYEAEYRLDKEKYYYPILLHTCVACMTTIGIIISIDTINIVCILHTCSLFKAISICVENIKKTDTEIDEKTHKEMHYHLFIDHHDSTNDDYDELMACLKKHQFAIEHAKVLDSTFTYATFFVLIMNVLILSIIGLQVLNKLEQNKTAEVVRFGGIAIAVTIHLMCTCLPGQLLIDRSAEVFDRTYGSQWYNFSARTKRLISILLYRSFVPCTVSAGYLLDMSMIMCSSVMQTAMSYFTTFASMK